MSVIFLITRELHLKMLGNSKFNDWRKSSFYINNKERFYFFLFLTDDGKLSYFDFMYFENFR